MIFFQQSSVVDKGMTEKDISFGKFDTAVGAFFTVVVAVACVILTGTFLFKPGGTDIDSAAQAAIAIIGGHPIVGSALAIGLFDAGLLGAICISLTSS
jgi:Mn2+/Fe2+ NRAMP family transporter